MSAAEPGVEATASLSAVRADDALIEHLAAGGAPDAGDELAALLAAWRDGAL